MKLVGAKMTILAYSYSCHVNKKKKKKKNYDSMERVKSGRGVRDLGMFALVFQLTPVVVPMNELSE